jgi:hypothetical protein
VVENLLCKSKTLNSKPYPTKKRRKMQKMMIDNSTCSSANWIQVLQNSLPTNQNSTKPGFPWECVLPVWSRIVLEVKWATGKCWWVFFPF